MKRFYKTAEVAPHPDDGFAILLDGRGVKTPARAPLVVPGVALAEAIAAEWNAQGEDIDPAAMPMTGFANAALDRVLPDVAAFARTIAAYGGSDLFCYRADGPTGLVDLQARHWNLLLDWARDRYDIHFAVTDGIMPVAQPEPTVRRLSAAVEGMNPWLLPGLSVIVSIGGTLVGALAHLDGAVDAAALWTATRVDEDWQVAQWGEDAEATAQAEGRRRQFEDAARFCALVIAHDAGLED